MRWANHGAAFDERFDRSGVHVVIDKGTALDTDGYGAFAAQQRRSMQKPPDSISASRRCIGGGERHAEW
ncbi:MAG: hypothetical protein ABSB70_08940 [Candidatus Velthaea sp.]